MKKILIVAMIALSSCNTAVIDPKSEDSHRIIGKEANSFCGYDYHIIEVDGVEYLSNSRGGICPLVKKDSLK